MPRDGVVVFVRLADRLLEDRRIRRDPAQAVFVDELLQPAIGDKAARQKIEPHRLAVVLQRFESIHCRLFLRSWAPDFLSLGDLILGGFDYLIRNETEFRQHVARSAGRAEAVHADDGAGRSGIAVPADRGAHFDRHPRGDLRRQHRVAITPRSWRSNSSQLGMLTTRAATPSALERLKGVRRTAATSLPVAIRMTSRRAAFGVAP